MELIMGISNTVYGIDVLSSKIDICDGGDKGKCKGDGILFLGCKYFFFSGHRYCFIRVPNMSKSSLAVIWMAFLFFYTNYFV